MSSVKIVGIKAKNVGPIGFVDVVELVSGLNLIVGRNEVGKSTLVEAVRCALFERHTARNQKIRDLQPNGTSEAPEIWLTLDRDGERISVYKRFIERPHAEVVYEGSGTKVEKERADERLLEMLDARPPGRNGGSRSEMGLWGLLWGTQDAGAHEDPGTQMDALNRGARQDAIRAQVGQLTGGRRGETERARAENRLRAREALALALSRRMSEMAQLRGMVAEIDRGLEAVAVGARLEAAELEDLRRALEASRTGVQGAERSVARIRSERERARLEARLALARTLEEERMALDAGSRDAAALEAAEAAIEQLVAQSRGLEARLGVLGTSVTIREGERERLTRAFGAKVTLAVDARGLSVEVDPARPGLAQARQRGLETARASRGTLEAVGADGIEGARRARRARRALEEDAEHLQRRLRTLAPQGTAVLAEAAERRRAEGEMLPAALEVARSASERMTGLRAEILKNTVTPEIIERLGKRVEARAVALGRTQASATHVEIRASRDLDVAIAGDEHAPLGAGAVLALMVDTPTHIVLGALAEITVAPGGNELIAHRSAFNAASAELSEALSAIGVESIEAAEARACARTERVAELAQAERELERASPNGLEALLDHIETAKRDVVSLEADLGEIASVEARSGVIAVELDANRVTEDALTRIEALHAAAETLERKAHALAASVIVRAADGSIICSARVVEPETLDLGDGWFIDVRPGEAGAEVAAELASTRATLEVALRDAQVSSLEALRERVAHSVAMVERAKGVRQRLEDQAPRGLRALERELELLNARIAALGERSDGLFDDREAEATLEVRREEVRALELRVRDAESKALAAQAARAQRDQDRLKAQMGYDHAARAHAEAAFELERARDADSDQALKEALDLATQELEKVKADREGAQAALRSAVPELLEGELERAKGALDAHVGRVVHARETIARLEATLSHVALEGRFELLSEALAEEQDILQRLSEIEREAGAVRMLAEAVEQAYRTAQERFVAPILEQVRPYLQRLRPGTELGMDPDLTLTRVERNGVAERFSVLSGGTREQLSMIVRVGLARVLAQGGRSMPLILEDTLGWTDDARRLTMAQILRVIAKDLQVIILSCQPSRFTRVNADRVVDLDAVARATETSVGRWH